MKLHSPSFDRSLRKRARLEIRKSPELKREYEASGRHRRWFSAAPFGRLVPSALLSWALWTVFNRTGHASTSLAVLALWLAAFVPLQANRLIQCLYASTDISALICLPLGDKDIWRWQFQKFWRGSTWLLLDITASLAVVGTIAGLPFTGWLMLLPVAVAAWLLVISLSLLSLIHLYKLPYHLAPGFFMVLGWILFFGRDLLGNLLIGWIDRVARDVNHFLPTAWPGAVFEAMLPGGPAMGLLLVLPVAALIWTSRSSMALLRDRYVVGEDVTTEAPDMVPAESGDCSETGKTQRAGLTDIEDYIMARRFLEQPGWRTGGILEKLLWRWFTPRERVLAEFAFPEGPGLTAVWITLHRNLAIALAIAGLTHFIFPAAQLWILIGGLGVVILVGVTNLCGTGSVMTLLECSGVNIPIHGAHGLGYREMGRLFFKHAAVQFPPFFLLSILTGAATSWFIGFSPILCVTFAIKVSIVILFSRPMIWMVSFSSGSNDTNQGGLRSCGIFCAVIPCVMIFFALGALGLFLPKPGFAWLCLLLSALVSYGVYRLYGWLYRNNWFDLTAVPQQNG